MRTQSNARNLVALAMLGFLAGAPFLACGGDDTTTASGGAGGAGASGSSSSGMFTCNINGMKEGLEACDDGNMTPGDGCELDCSFTCAQGVPGNGDEKCTDGDPCNGNETCAADHTCTQGTPAADNTDCGMGKVCKNGVCGAINCGDGFVSPPEACDDGNITNGDGCDSCQFSCTIDADCVPADICAGNGTCDTATHICAAGTPLPDNTPCMGGFCNGGTCAAASCGDSTVTPGEDCDDGNVIDGDGCDVNCTFSCVNPGADCAAPPTCQMAACDANHVCDPTTDPAQDGMQCGPNSACVNGDCTAATCGNGIVEIGEACDFGGSNGPNAGCEANCQFSCTTAADCSDSNECNGAEPCQDVTVNGQLGHACAPATPLPMCAACTGGVCIGGTCAASTCGDGCVGPGEQCDPPGTMCSSICTDVICGNGFRDTNEECDDGNLINLDGCDSTCKFEQSLRATWLKMQFATDSFCPANQIGSAITTTAQPLLQSGLDSAVGDGSIGIMITFLDLDDLTGTSDPQLTLGVTNALLPMQPYDGTNDLDWWQYADPTSIDANRVPNGKLPASIAAKVLTGGPGNITLNLNLAGTPAGLKLADVSFTISIGTTSTPLTSTGGTPGHLASEHLDPALVSFAWAGERNANGAGKLCGNVIAASLDVVAVPPDLIVGGAYACSEGYTMSNSLLDVFVGGCLVLGVLPAIISRQPDKMDLSVPQPGAGGPYTLEKTGTDVTGCLDVNNMPVDLTACLNAAAYSAYFKLAMGRVIVK